MFSVPSSAPANVRAVPVSFNKVAVTWDIVPPIDQNGVITLYEVCYWPLHIQNGSRGARIVNASVKTLNLTLALLGSYGISVRAYSDSGVGPYSENVTTIIPSQGNVMVSMCMDFDISPSNRIPSVAEFSSTE